MKCRNVAPLRSAKKGIHLGSLQGTQDHCANVFQKEAHTTTNTNELAASVGDNKMGSQERKEWWSPVANLA